MYHSGVEVHGTEYTFASEAGIFHHSPKDASGAKFRESIVLGEVMMGSKDVENIVNSLRPDFPGDSYNLLTQNCNCFANALVRSTICLFVYIHFVPLMRFIFNYFIIYNICML